MEHVETVPGSVARQDVHFFVLAQEHDVLQRGGFVGFDFGAGAFLAGDDLEVDEVDVDGVGPAAAVVDEFPELDGASWGFGEDAVIDVVEGYAVDFPGAVSVGSSLVSKRRMW